MTSKEEPDTSWNISVSFINNPFMLRLFVKMCLITWFIIALLVVVP